MQKLEYSGMIGSIPGLPMTWLLISPGHQQPWYWPCLHGIFHLMCACPDSKVHGAHLGPVGPRWAPCWHHGPSYQGVFTCLSSVADPMYRGKYHRSQKHQGKLTQMNHVDACILVYVLKKGLIFFFCLKDVLKLIRFSNISINNNLLIRDNVLIPSTKCK